MTAVTEKPKKAKAEPLKMDQVTADDLIVDAEPDETDPVVRSSAKPGEPEFSWDDEYPGEDVFVFTAKDGTTVGLAGMGEKRRPKPGVLRKLRHQPPIEQMWFIIERVSSPAALAVSDEFDDEDYSQMWEQWSDWSNTSAGESSRSSTS